MQLEEYFERANIGPQLTLKAGKSIKLSEFLCLCGNITKKDFLEYGGTCSFNNEIRIVLFIYEYWVVVVEDKIIIEDGEYEFNDRLNFSNMDYCKEFVSNKYHNFKELFPYEDNTIV